MGRNIHESASRDAALQMGELKLTNGRLSLSRCLFSPLKKRFLAALWVFFFLNVRDCRGSEHWFVTSAAPPLCSPQRQEPEQAFGASLKHYEMTSGAQKTRETDKIRNRPLSA